MIWSHTRCRCAIAPLEKRRRRRSFRVPRKGWTQWAAALMQSPPTPRRGRHSRKAILKGWTQWAADLIKLSDGGSSRASKSPGVRRGCKAAIAQLAARRSHNPKVVSSILTRRMPWNLDSAFDFVCSVSASICLSTMHLCFLDT